MMIKKQSITPKKGPKTLGPYSPAIKLGDFVFVSGQLPINAATEEVVEGGIRKQAAQVFENIEMVLKESNLTLRQVVKTTIFLKNLEDFNSVNQIYALYFTSPYPARSCVEVSALPKDALIEVECIAYDTKEIDDMYDIENDDCGGDECVEDE